MKGKTHISFKKFVSAVVTLAGETSSVKEVVERLSSAIALLNKEYQAVPILEAITEVASDVELSWRKVDVVEGSHRLEKSLTWNGQWTRGRWITFYLHDDPLAALNYGVWVEYETGTERESSFINGVLGLSSSVETPAK